MEPEPGPHVVLAGGATGGHLYPGLALAQALRDNCPQVKLTFLGGRCGLDAQLVPEAGYRLVRLAAGRGSPVSLRKPLNAPRFALACAQCMRLFARERPHAVVGLGGFAAGAPGLVAAWRGMPLILLEQNAIPGRVTRFLSRWAAEIHLEFPQARGLLSGAKGEIVDAGSPVRRAIADLADRAYAPASRDELLVIGGSQGAHRLNLLVAEAAPTLVRAGVCVRHITGDTDHARVAEAYAPLGEAAQALAYTHEMAQAYARARVVVSRAGGSTAAELWCAGLPAILVPFPEARDDHQTANARAQVQTGGAVLAVEKELCADRLTAAVLDLWHDTERLQRMSSAMRGLGRPDAADRIARRVLTLAGCEVGIHEQCSQVR